MRYFITFPSGREVEASITHLPTGQVEITIGDRRFFADSIAPTAGATSMRLDGKMLDLWMEGAPPDVGVIASGLRFYAKVESERERALSTAAGRKSGKNAPGTVVSPMPGRILKVLVAEGDHVTRGTPLVVVEAMKMENELMAEQDGRVTKVFVTPGTNVEGGAKLVALSD